MGLWLAVNILAYLHQALTTVPLKNPFTGSVDEGVTEGLPTLQSTSSTNAHADDDDRLVPTVCPFLVKIVLRALHSFCVFPKLSNPLTLHKTIAPLPAKFGQSCSRYHP